MSLSVQLSAGGIGKEYPSPIVDHASQGTGFYRPTADLHKDLVNLQQYR
jgi:hypothetical protein